MGVGAVDRHAILDLEELVAFAQVLEADAGALFGGGLELQVVLYMNGVGLGLADGDVQGTGRRDDIMLDAVLHEQL